MLTEQTRYRVTGAVFLVALAAIFLPMLFDGDGIAPLDLPDLPRPEIERLEPVHVPDTAPTLAASMAAPKIPTASQALSRWMTR